MLLVAIVTPVVIVASWHDVDPPTPKLGFDRAADRWLRATTARVFFALVLAVESCAMFLFLATDVFLFYVFFEVILIPMYFLIGGFGGARRAYAASKFLIFGLLGGFVMLASVIGLYVLSARAGQASYLLSDLTRADHRHRDRPLAVRRLHVRVRDQGTAGAAAHLAAGRRRGVQPRRRDHDGRGDGQDRHLRDDPVLPRSCSPRPAGGPPR